MTQKLIIDRSKWLRGEGSDDSYLLRERDGKMCCLGFWCLANGLPPEAMTNRTTPVRIPNVLEIVPAVEPLTEICCAAEAATGT